MSHIFWSGSYSKTIHTNTVSSKLSNISTHKQHIVIVEQCARCCARQLIIYDRPLTNDLCVKAITPTHWTKRTILLWLVLCRLLISHVIYIILCGGHLRDIERWSRRRISFEPSLGCFVLCHSAYVIAKALINHSLPNRLEANVSIVNEITLQWFSAHIDSWFLHIC